MKNKTALFGWMILIIAAGNAAAVNCTNDAGFGTGGTARYWSTGFTYTDPMQNGDIPVGHAWLYGEFNAGQNCVWSWDYTLTYIDGNATLWANLQNQAQFVNIPYAWESNSTTMLSNYVPLWPTCLNGVFGDFACSAGNLGTYNHVTYSGGAYHITGTRNDTDTYDVYKPYMIGGSASDPMFLTLDGLLTNSSSRINGLSSIYILWSNETRFSDLTTTTTTVSTSSTSTTSTTIKNPSLNITVSVKNYNPKLNGSNFFVTVKSTTWKTFLINNEITNGTPVFKNVSAIHSGLEAWASTVFNNEPFETDHEFRGGIPIGQNINVEFSPTFQENQENKTICVHAEDSQTSALVWTSYLRVTDSAYPIGGEHEINGGTEVCFQTKKDNMNNFGVNARADHYENFGGTVPQNAGNDPIAFRMIAISGPTNETTHINGYVLDMASNTNRTDVTVCAMDVGGFPNTNGRVYCNNGNWTGSLFSINSLIVGRTYKVYISNSDGTESAVCQKGYSTQDAIPSTAVLEIKCLAPYVDPPSPNPTTGQIKVHVQRSDTKTPIVSASVTISCNGQNEPPLMTNSIGEVTFSGLRTDCAYDVRASKSTYYDNGAPKTKPPGTALVELSLKNGPGPGPTGIKNIKIFTQIKNCSQTTQYSTPSQISIYLDGERVDFGTTTNGFIELTPDLTGRYEVRGESGCAEGSWKTEYSTITGEESNDKEVVLICTTDTTSCGGTGEESDMSQFIVSLVPLFKIIVFFMAIWILAEIVKRMRS